MLFRSKNMPALMKQAVLNTAQWIEERPAGGIASERIGDYQYTLRQAPGSLEQTVPASAVDLLATFRRPELAM